MDLVSYVIVPMITGIFTSIIFMLIIYLFWRPKIKLSHIIAEKRSKKAVYRIKVINKTRAPVIINHAELHFIKLDTIGRWRAKSIKLTRRHGPIWLDNYNPKDNNSDYSYIFKTKEDIIQRMRTKDQNVRIRLFCTHSISGVTRSFQQIYSLENIKEGTFKVGDSFEIIN